MPTTTTDRPHPAARPHPAVRPAAPGTLRLARPTARTFPGRRPAPLAGIELAFMTDFLAAFGEEPDHGRYARGGGHTFTDMARDLLDGLERPLPPLDRLLLAHHLPDLSVVEVAGCYLAERCPGDPEVYSVAGQGVGAPFTALRILSATRRGGDLAEGAVLVLDQTTVPYRDPDVDGTPLPPRDCAVLVRTDCAGTEPGADLDFVDERTADPGETLRALLDRHPEARLAAGRQLVERLDARLRADERLVEGAGDLHCTSAWAALAEHWTPERYQLVADWDPHAGRLFTAGLHPGAEL
ncbi:hypothetical protein GCM10010441_69760 [Kitasatospora paracochleata]|uniref:Uncharacterized protein n=1 Tax=Kitasatospora paracochleata TaxID=58354 RepID=A0ABT1JA72_9ACTN|nr:hypothetical protein [Kitasatospora paracochleata]MCP2314363.1 hypothetical protein [Kitasatospora paracochleata]